MELIDKAALVAKIRKRLLSVIREKHYDEYEEGQDSERIAILGIIDTLEVKEVDLEEKATQLSQKYFPDEENIWARSNIEAQRCKSACIEMAEWFKAQKGE